VNAVMANALKPGGMLMVPYLAEIKGTATSVAVGLGKTVWVGTSYGVLALDKSGWSMPGYRDTVVTGGVSLQQLVKSVKVCLANSSPPISYS